MAGPIYTDSPSEMEIAEHVVQSVIEIRRFLTEVLGDGGIAQELAGSLRAMRGACRAFLDESHVEHQGGLYVPESIHLGYYRNGLEDWQMNQALGKMRGLFGVHIALVADRYGLQVEPELASILPPEPE